MITVLFSCRACGLEKKPVRVRIRHANEDVVHWVEKAAAAAGVMHELLSPVCTCRKVDLMIPMPKNKSDGIGFTQASER